MQHPAQGLLALEHAGILIPSQSHREFHTPLPSGGTPTGDPTPFPPTLPHFSLFSDVFSIPEVPLKSPNVNRNQLWLLPGLIN